jgi:hypothetical protein
VWSRARACGTRAGWRASDQLNVPIAILTLALVAVVVLVISAPLRSARRGTQQAPGALDGDGHPAGARTGHGGGPGGESARATRAELDAAREAKYREIRDAELDYRTGKLSREDYDAINGELRAEAIEILNRLEADEP